MIGFCVRVDGFVDKMDNEWIRRMLSFEGEVFGSLLAKDLRKGRDLSIRRREG